jgi:multidrug efflux pump subunit AcrA (membrane-fusion protein)
MKTFKLLLIATLSLPFVAHGESASEDEVIVKVETQPFFTDSHGATYNLSCEVETKSPVILSAVIDSELTFLLPKGKMVTTGDVIAKQNTFYKQNELKKNAILLESEVQNKEYRYKEFTRAQKQGSLISEAELDRLKWQLEQSKNEVSLIKNEIAKLNYQLSNSELKVIGNYEVSEHYTRLGQFINRGDIIVALTPLDGNELVCNVPLSSEVINSSNLVFKYNNKLLNLDRTASIVDLETQSRKIYLSLENDQELNVGERVDVKAISIDAKSAKIPSAAINYSPSGEAFVWLINGDTANKVIVNLLAGTSGKILSVTGKLPMDGDVVVMSDLQIEDGSKVSVTNKLNSL